ncbi:hypothetical protein E4K72_05205 [Oxalobacteraceae bacterium OM1]|nr:hypothetical protein E4K72_05205 [Oxalobacteraceae bacterium OM1]
MSLTYDVFGLPSCCGVGLLPGDPHTECPRCSARYDTEALALHVQHAKSLAAAQAAQGHEVSQTARYPY